MEKPITWKRYKRPVEELEYGLDWNGGIGDDTIEQSTWAIADDDGSLEKYDAVTAISGRKTYVGLRGGVAGKKYKVVNTIITSRPNTLQRCAILTVL